ncbi:MAG: HAMP domain-containing histidine kinase [Bifidobacteriaceae bacterium]|nr:HAMP domain-containing histidine kinase [Bifidobacteriaceae bacterium]
MPARSHSTGEVLRQRPVRDFLSDIATPIPLAHGEALSQVTLGIGVAGGAMAAGLGVAAWLMSGMGAVVWGNIYLCLATGAVITYIRRTGQYERGYTAIVILVFLCGFPFLYLAGGDYRPTMSYFFLFGLALTPLLIQGSTFFILTSLELVAYTTCWLLGRSGWLVEDASANAPVTNADLLEAVGYIVIEFSLVVVLFVLNRFYLRSRYQEVLATQSVERASREKDALLATVAHELNTPLAVIGAVADETRSALQTAPLAGSARSATHGVTVIGEEARRLGDMVSRLLDLSRLSDGRLQLNIKREDLGEVIENVMPVCARMCQPNGNSLVLEPGDSSPLVLCDAARISQVVINLVSNATRHTHGGTISISLDQDDQFAIISVADTGEGMSPEVLATVHNPEVVRPSSTGLGLGLSISRAIVHQHGGTASMTSEPGVGTVASFTLPLALPDVAGPGQVGVG